MANYFRRTLFLVITLLALIFSPVTGDYVANRKCNEKNLITGSCDDEQAAKAAKVLEGIQGAKGQARYQFIEPKRLNIETVAGIKDMNLGKVKNGAKIGNPVIRFDTGAKTGHKPHINIDPRGYPRSDNLHIPLPGPLVSTASAAQKVAVKAGTALNYLAIATDAVRLGSAVKADYDDYSKTEKTSGFKRQAPKRPIGSNTIKTGSSIAGGWTGGYAGGYLGGQVGAFAGGAVFGLGGLFPPGALVGAVIGGITCGLIGAITGASVGSDSAEFVAKQIVD